MGDDRNLQEASDDPLTDAWLQETLMPIAKLNGLGALSLREIQIARQFWAAGRVTALVEVEELRVVVLAKQPAEEVCELCQHSLRDNSHGFDQNDGYLDENSKSVHSGRCTYCRVCRGKPEGGKRICGYPMPDWEGQSMMCVHPLPCLTHSPTARVEPPPEEPKLIEHPFVGCATTPDRCPYGDRGDVCHFERWASPHCGQPRSAHRS